MTGSNELSGKVAIVTGAGRNIGRAIALALAEAGAWIVVNARSNHGEADAVAREIACQPLSCQYSRVNWRGMRPPV